MRTSTLLALLPLANVALGFDLRGRLLRRDDDDDDECGRPVVDSEELQEKITVKRMMRHARALQSFSDKSEGKNRAVGTEGYEMTEKYIYSTIRRMRRFWDVEYQPFSLTIRENVNVSVVVNGENIESARFMTNSPNATLDDAEIVKVANVGCEQSDYPASLEGKVALISRGECTFSSKSARAGVAGAVAALIYNTADEPFAGTLGSPDEIGPHVGTAGISLSDGLAIADKLSGSEPVAADVVITSTIREVQTNNVIATSKTGDPDNIVFLGAHHDSVPAGAGINDNGSGTMALLNLASALTKFTINNRVRIGWWSAEEVGLLGSTHYVQNTPAEELQKVRVYLNFDMIASPNYVLGVYDGSGGAFNVSGPPGSAETQRLFEDFFKDNDFNSVPSEFTGRSDYGPFLDAGVPCGGLFTGAEVNKTEEEAKLFGGQAGVSYDANYHKVGDDITNLNKVALEINAKAIAHSCATFAASFEGFPPRQTANETAALPRRSIPRSNHAHHRLGGDSCSPAVM